MHSLSAVMVAVHLIPFNVRRQCSWTVLRRAISVQLSNQEFNGDGAMHSYLLFVRNRNTRDTMTKMKALSAVIILSAAIATPVFAQDAIGPGYGLELQPVTNYRSNYRVPSDQNFRGAYDQSGEPFHAPSLSNKERDNIQDFGFSGRDPSMVGGEDPYLHPGG
jgi:hypothetical protein